MAVYLVNNKISEKSSGSWCREPPLWRRGLLKIQFERALKGRTLTTMSNKDNFNENKPTVLQDDSVSSVRHSSPRAHSLITNRTSRIIYSAPCLLTLVFSPVRPAAHIPPSSQDSSCAAHSLTGWLAREVLTGITAGATALTSTVTTGFTGTTA